MDEILRERTRRKASSFTKYKFPLSILLHKHFKKDIFEGLPSCEQNNLKILDGIQTMIYGKTCGSTKGGKNLEQLEGRQILEYQH